jgi:hypothetical protein
MTACQRSTALLTFRPTANAHLRYQVDVHSTSVTTLDGSAPRRRQEVTRLIIDQRVVGSTRDGVTVEVELRGEGQAPQRFVARLDRSGQLAEIDRVEGIPASLLGRLGIAELFPVAAGSPPPRRLGAGEHWALRQPVIVPDRKQVSLTGEGKLTAFSIDGRRRVARVDETYRLPVRQTAPDPAGTITLAGTETTKASTTRWVNDGSVVRVHAHTTGRFRVTITAPASAPLATAGTTVSGTMTIEVDSTTRRLD